MNVSLFMRNRLGSRGRHDPEADWTPTKQFIKKLEAELNDIWRAQSEVTRREAVQRILESFYSMLEEENFAASDCRALGQEIWSTFTIVILMDASLKVPKDYLENPQYVNTTSSIVDILFDAVCSKRKSSDQSKLCVRYVLLFFTKALDANQWEIRYRILQVIVQFLKKLTDGDISFSSTIPGENSNGDFVRTELFKRLHDTKDKVAALAVEGIACYQFLQKEPLDTSRKSQVIEFIDPHKTKAFAVLNHIMEEGQSYMVRKAAVKNIAILSSSASRVLRRVMDEHWEVRVATYEVIGEYIGAQILQYQLRSFVILAGLNHEKVEVRSAAYRCLQQWLDTCCSDYAALMCDIGVSSDGPHRKLYAARQLSMENVFGTPAQPTQES